MSALSIQPTFPIFTDIDGQPLEAGYVWIGTANLDPQTNPINVYWDAALTIAAVQPIRTLAGYPSNSGTPARLYVNSDYSIRVMNKNGSTVYSAAAVTERYSDVVVGGVDSSEVSYLPAGTGAVATTVQTKLRESVSVKDFGAVGDGVTNNLSYIHAALNSGATYVHIPTDGVYAWSGNIVIPSNVKLLGGELKALSTSSQIQLTNSNSTLDGVTVTGTLNDTQYLNAVNGVVSYFSSASVLTNENFVALGTLGAGKISGNLITLGLFSDVGTSTTRVLSAKIPINSSKRYVIDIQNDLVSSGYIASEVKFRAYDAGGSLIVGNSSITVDANGVYQYILPETYSLGNYLWLDSASFIEVSFAVTRVTNQPAGQTCVFDASKIQVYELINDFATLSKTSYDNGFCAVAGGTNNSVTNCLFKNIVPTAIEANNSTNAKIIGNRVYNCMAGINATTTTNTTIFNNHIDAYFGGLGQRAFRWKGLAGIDNPGLQVVNNVCDGYFWGCEMINSASLLPNTNCLIKGNSVKAISAGYSLSGYKDTVISDNSAIVGQLGKYLIEFPQTNINCEVSNNTLNSLCQHRQTIGISGVGAFIANSKNKITNNTIRSALGIIATLGGTNTVDSYQGVVVAGNTINYTATGLFSNIGGINVSNNTLNCEYIGSNDAFGGVRTAIQVNGLSYLYEATVVGNSIWCYESYAIVSEFTRWMGVKNNSIKHDSNVFQSISLGAHPAAAMQLSCINNTFDVSSTSTQDLIEITGSYYAGSYYNITNNLRSMNLNGSGDPFAGVSTVAGLSKNSQYILRGNDTISYTGTTPVTTNAFSFTVDAVKNGSYMVEMIVHNGDFNHVISSNYVLLVTLGGVNQIKSMQLAQTASTGSLILTAILSISGSNIVCSGTTAGSPANASYIIKIRPLLQL